MPEADFAAEIRRLIPPAQRAAGDFARQIEQLIADGAIVVSDATLKNPQVGMQLVRALECLRIARDCAVSAAVER